MVFKIKIKILLSLFILFPTTVFADLGLGVGVGMDISSSPDTFVSASFRTDTNPWCISVSAHFNDKFASFKNAWSFSADNWFVYNSLEKNIDYFCLWGFSGGIEKDFSSGDDFSFAFGSRLGAGLDFFFLDRRTEFFAQFVWDLRIGLERENDEFNMLFAPDNFPISAGIRVWN